MTPKERDRPARAALEAKVALIESWVAAEDIPADAPALKTVKDVQQWTDQAKGLTTWTSYSIAAPGGANGDLRVRLDLALEGLSRLVEGNPGKPKKSRRGKAISQVQVEQERTRLAVQNVELLAEREMLRADVSRLRHLLVEKDNHYRELLTKFDKIAPFGKR
jgi:hypothetical protein